MQIGMITKLNMATANKLLDWFLDSDATVLVNNS